MGSSSTGLKRLRSNSTQDAPDGAHIPQLPNISGEIILQVFTHKSLRRSKSTNEDSDYCDNERLSELGRIVLQTAVTHILFCREPPLKVHEIGITTDEILSDENVDNWVTIYGLRDKLRCEPDVVSQLHNAEETRVLFNSYVGGVFVESGIDIVQEWITLLVEPGHPPKPGPYEPPFKKVKSEPNSPNGPARSPPHFPRTPSPPPPAIFYQPLPLPLPNPLAPGRPNLPFLSLFNQTAHQRRVTVTYPAEFSGPPHAGTWAVKCVVSGIEKGIGHGVSKQIAKEAAARQACYSMGWAPRMGFQYVSDGSL